MNCGYLRLVAGAGLAIIGGLGSCSEKDSPTVAAARGGTGGIAPAPAGAAGVPQGASAGNGATSAGMGASPMGGSGGGGIAAEVVKPSVVSVRFMTLADITPDYGGLCSCGGADGTDCSTLSSTAKCWDNYQKHFTLKADWDTYTMTFAELATSGWGTPVGGFKPEELLGVSFFFE